MKKIIWSIGIFFFSLFVFSCNDDFLTPKSLENYLGDWSPILISPEWEAKDYAVHYAAADDNKFTITHVPFWLNISSLSGQFTDGIVSLNCKANKCSIFSEIGSYCSYIVLLIENKGSLVVPVVYITEGNPVAEIPSHLTIENNNLQNIKLPIKNIGDGILTWSISKYPEWLSLEYQYSTILIASIPVPVLSQDQEGNILFSYNKTKTPSSENLSGKIVITTNDKNKPEVEVDIDLDITGSPY